MKKTALLLATLLAGFAASAQTLDETIEVSIVNVDVHVTDRQGNRITGLKAGDFEVRDDGRVQSITNFSEYAPERAAATAGIEAGQPPRQRRTVVLFIEPATLANFRSRQLFDSIRTLLHQTVEKGDQVSVVTFVNSMDLRVPFTDDLTVVDAELAKLEKEMTGAEGTLATRMDDSVEMLALSAAAEAEFQAALGQMGITEARGSGVSPAQVRPARRQRFLIKQKALALEALIQSISGADGKKILIMATRRFGLYAGAEYFDGQVPESHKQELDTASYRDALIRTANANGVTIYPIHPEGLSPSVDRSEATSNWVLMNETAALKEVADATGGVTAWGSADIAKILPRVSDDLDSYYSIGYRTPATKEDAARRIAVKTKNPAYTVRTRQQFVEKSDVTEMKDRIIANLFQRVSGSSMGIPFDVALGTVKPKGKNRWSVPLKIKVPIKALTALPRGNEYAGKFSVYVATGSIVGVMSEVDRRSQPYQFPAAERAKAQASHFTYELELTVDQLANRLSIGVLDEVGKEYGIKRFTLPKR